MSKTRGLNRNPKELVYGALQTLDFDAVTLAINQANTTVQARLPGGVPFKIMRVTALLSGAVAGTCSFNIVQGTAAEGGVGPDDTYDQDGVIHTAANGAQVFTSDKALTMTADAVQNFTPANPEVIYPATAELTIRTVTNGTAAGTLKVLVWVKPVHTQPTQPMGGNPAHPFNPATDL